MNSTLVLAFTSLAISVTMSKSRPLFAVLLFRQRRKLSPVTMRRLSRLSPIRWPKAGADHRAGNATTDLADEFEAEPKLSIWTMSNPL